MKEIILEVEGKLLACCVSCVGGLGVMHWVLLRIAAPFETRRRSTLTIMV